MRASRIRLPTYCDDVQGIINEIVRTDENEPQLVLGGHCQICEFGQSCLTKAVEQDDLSLLGGINEKEIARLNRRGIFTVTQLSYTYRPRKRKKQIRPSRAYSFALKALSNRENTVFINSKPDLPEAKTQIFLDVEGIPERSFDYLLGLVVVEGGKEKRYSFWADDETEESSIFKEFLDIINEYRDPHLFHYGSYETKYFKRMRRKLGSEYEETIDRLLDKSTNLLQAVYTHIYFPTYSNGLKDIAGFLGYRWSDSQASGIQSLVWRARWELSRDAALRRKLVQYNDDLSKNPFDEEFKDIVQRFATLLREIVETIDTYGLKKRHLNKHKKHVERFFGWLEKQAFTSEVALKCRQRLTQNQGRLFTFLDYDGVPWNNNGAEHTFKTFGMFRRIVDGLLTEDGMGRYLKLLSIYQTCRLKGINCMDFFLSGKTDIDEFVQAGKRKD